MRSLRDDGQTAQNAGPAPGAALPGARSPGEGDAPMHRNPSVPQSEIRALLAYLRACLRREAVHTHGMGLDLLGTDECACLPAGPELLFSGAGETLPLGPAATRVLRAADRGTLTLRYGYPLVILGEGTERSVLPLLTVDVRAATPAEGPGVPRVRAVGPPDVNPALLARAGITDPEDLLGLRARLRSGAPGTGNRPAALAALAAQARDLLARLEIERIDDIDPRAVRGAPRSASTGAHNVALLFLAGPGAGGHGTGTVGDVLADLDPSDPDGFDPADIGGTALEALLGPFGGPDGASAGTDGPGDGEEPVPICADGIGQSRYEALSEAMRGRLTAVAAPPGTGAHDLVDAVVRTAVGTGQRVLVCGASEADVREFLDRSGKAPDHPVVRVGGEEHLVGQVRLLASLLSERPGSAVADDGGAAAREDLARHWSRVRKAWAAMDDLASGGHELARLVEERRRAVAEGWDPDTLFTPERGGPEYWLYRAERAGAAGLAGHRHRAAVRRELGVSTDPAGLDRLCSVARLQTRWRAAVDRRVRSEPLGRLTEELADALERHGEAGTAWFTLAVDDRLRRGRPALENRIESLNWHQGGGWPGMPALLDTLPAWTCRTDQVRALPPRAGLFDFVVVTGAEHTRVAELLPALYRGRRALVVGDPACPGPGSALEPDEERRMLTAAGLNPDRAGRRRLRHGSGSALDAVRACTGTTLWLDEHTGAPPLLAEVALRHCYDGRAEVRIRPGPDGGPPLEWRDVGGRCEPVPGMSCVNRDEAYRTVVVVDEVDEHLPAGRVIAVVTPLQPQEALLRRLLGRRALRHQVRVGGPGLLRHDRDAADVTVLSPVLAEGAPAAVERRVRRMRHMWSSVLTRTRQRLVVVGDRAYWSTAGGPLGDLASPPAERTDPAVLALADGLREAGARVVLAQPVAGGTADMAVHLGARRLLLLLDRAPDGRALRRLVDRGDALGRAAGDPVVVVPAWRCFADRGTLVGEILAAR
ncbi:DNA helicase [Nocardiopsis algeriensis]|uniref:DNA helicase n=1 Tax=Nocardiopsis algeriensis TaxID=1478215 RepID=UPI003B430406